jgi:uncharacterized membrane protein required for colicin V production
MDLAWIDALGMGLLGAFLILGFVRGLWWQVIRAVGLFAAVVVARSASPALAPWLREQWPELSLRSSNGIAWAVLFVLALSAATLFGILGRKLLQAMQLGLADRLGGAAVGAVTGLGLHVAVLVILCQLASEAFLARTLTDTASGRIVDVAGARWPVVLGKEAGGEVGLLLERARLAADGESAPAPVQAAPTVPLAQDAPLPYQEASDPEPPYGGGVR